MDPSFVTRVMLPVSTGSVSVLGAVYYDQLFSEVGTEATSAVSAVLPIAIPVLAILIGVGVALKVIRRTTGR